MGAHLWRSCTSPHQIADLTGNLAGEVRRVELGNEVNTGLAG